MKFIRGFSLVELAVSLTIIGFIASSALSVAVTNDWHVKLSETNAKMDRIEEALAGYLALNLRLPCPADGTLAVTSGSFGVEGTPSEVSCASANFNDAGNIYAGVVPVTTLQLPDDFMFDGWGRRITYAIDYRFANSDNTVGSSTDCDGGAADTCFIDAPDGSITIEDSSGSNRLTDAILVLLSHGENGHGAYPKNGGARINAFPVGNPYRADSADELENAHFSNAGADINPYDDVFVAKSFIREDDSTDANPEYFDDIVRFKTKEMIVKDSGTILFDSICRDAITIGDNPGSNDCTGADDESNCESFAQQIELRCLQ